MTGSKLYKIIRFIVQRFYPEPQFQGTKMLPDEPCIVVGNHAQMNGPIACELYYPRPHAIWCAGEMMHLKDVPDYAYRDFWLLKPREVRWIYRILSYTIAPVSVAIFNNASCIGVYHDSRIISTFRESVRRLINGEDIVVFPEHAVPYNHILYEFQNRFVDLAKYYYKKTGLCVQFVPMYLAPYLKMIQFGDPVRYDPSHEPEEERVRIAKEMMNRITEMAVSLPDHKVVPYLNVSKAEYPMNRDEENNP